MLPSPKLFGGEYGWYDLVSYITLFVYTLFFITYGKKKTNLNWIELLLILYACTVVGSVGSKIFSVLEHFFTSDFSFSQFDFIDDYKNSAGHRWYGTLFMLLAVSPLLLLNYSRGKYVSILDVFSIGSCITLIIGKIGCFLEGHFGCYGVPTSLFWGVTFPYGNARTSTPVHPIQIYDSLFHLIVLFFLFRKPRIGSGKVTLTFLIATSLYNIIIESIRTNKVVICSLSFAQIVYIIMLCIILVIAIYRYKIFKSKFFQT